MCPSPAKKPYQGYANYETWAVALWLDNDGALYDERLSVIDRAITEPDPERPHRTEKWAVADALEAWVKGLAPDLGPTLWNDLLNASLGHVDWAELADGYLAEYREEQEAGS